MKILLVVPTAQYRIHYPAFLSLTDFPTGFAYLASALKAAGHEVYGLNPNNDTKFANQREMIETKLQEALANIRPDLVGTGGICTEYQFLKDTIQIVRKNSPGTPIVLGGGIINNDAEFAFQALKPDFCVRGEAEEVLVELAGSLNGGATRYANIPNLGFWENGSAQFTRMDFHYGDLDKRALPDYEIFGVQEMMDNYWLASRNLWRYTRFQPRPWPIVAARSCPFSCSFCVHNRGAKYRARSIDNLMEEIGHFYPRHQFNILFILDELFAISNSRLRQFSEAMLKAREEKGWDFNWYFQTHASASFDEDTLKLAKRAGCYYFSYGMESASPTVLASMNKRTKPAQFVNAIKTADKLRIGFGGNFIFGDPAESPKTLAETLDFFRDYCMDINIGLFSLRPYPGSRLFDYCLSKGLITDKLSFYENIDQPINMTSMPNLYWTIWILALDYLGGMFLWLKSTKAISCEPVKSEAENPIARHYGMQVCKVEAVCPHCGQTVYLEEMVAHGTAGQAFSMSRTKSGIIALLWSVRTKKWFFYCCYVSALVASLVFKPLKLLLYLKNQEKFGVSKIVTGCPQCNKWMRVQV
jgi:radical SAM superfamily enzyme YgiQ (UPF0313 family)